MIISSRLRSLMLYFRKILRFSSSMMCTLARIMIGLSILIGMMTWTRTLTKRIWGNLVGLTSKMSLKSMLIDTVGSKIRYLKFLKSPKISKDCGQTHMSINHLRIRISLKIKETFQNRKIRHKLGELSCLGSPVGQSPTTTAPN